MDANFPYLPHIVRDVVEEVDEVLSNRLIDPFRVHYGYGLQADVTFFLKKAEDQGLSEDDLYPFVWLPMNIANQRGKRWDRYSYTTFDIIIAGLTKHDYTMDEREQLNLFPRLYPIYKEFINQLGLSDSVDIGNKEDLKHTEIWRPYWGGNEDGTGTNNLFKKQVDALHIKGIIVQVNKIKECTPVFTNVGF